MQCISYTEKDWSLEACYIYRGTEILSTDYDFVKTEKTNP